MTFFLRPSLVNHRVVDGVVMQSVFTVFCSVARWLSVGSTSIVSSSGRIGSFWPKALDAGHSNPDIRLAKREKVRLKVAVKEIYSSH